MIGAKPFSRLQAAQYVARAIERIRADEIDIDGREAIAEPLLERLLVEFRQELIRLGTIRARPDDKAGPLQASAPCYIGGGCVIHRRWTNRTVP